MQSFFLPCTRFAMVVLFALLMLSTSVDVAQAQVDALTAERLVEGVTVGTRPVASTGEILLPLITWGGDIATIYTHTQGIFAQEGLNVKLQREDKFKSQVEACIGGVTPYLRGTMGMINAAAEAFKAKGLELVVIYQLTWSVGGDAMVVRSNIKKPADLKGKKIALQLYGPHMDYVANILNTSQISLSDISLTWLSELTLPTYDTFGKIIDPVSAFQADESIDAVMCIIPDALMLTSGGKTGTGAEGSVGGAKILISSKTASRVIADVYAVRKDYFDAHKAEVQKFVHALMRGQEALVDLLKNKKSQQAVYMQLLTASADMLLGASQATADAEALLGDCEFVGHDGNVRFFTGKGTTRKFSTLNREIQKSYGNMGLMIGTVPIKSANWDYKALSQGLKYATLVSTTVASKPKSKPKPKFDTQKITQKIEEQIAVEPTTWAEEGTLFIVEIYFNPNQSNFSVERYSGDFQKALEIAQTYGGALIIIEGHSDPLGILTARKDGKKLPAEIAQMEQKAKTLALQRANAVRQSFLDFCQQSDLVIDSSQFVPIGLGIASPKYSPPRTKEEWAANRRVVFRIKQIEAELAEFVPLQ